MYNKCLPTAKQEYHLLNLFMHATKQNTSTQLAWCKYAVRSE